ncbi:dTDP-4-dehydro-6-deoxyglucose reductase [Lachnospiraceae bacterium]|nr:dTDP-4-dehydro-6-deoxyglucose reductase [Lachnospiraceae bacterium]
MKILVLGSTGFIGKNIIRNILNNGNDELFLFDKKKFEYELGFPDEKIKNCHMICAEFCMATDFETLTKDIDIVYHLISTTLPNTPMQRVAAGLEENVVVTSLLLEACVKNKVKKIIFLSSGGTVYGLSKEFPFREDSITTPISAYGLQKVAIEKLIYLYGYTYGIDYRIVRLANPYGRYQSPNGIQGVITTFIFRALHNEEICVYGNGEIIRDYIYIDDAVNAIQNIVKYQGEYKTFNVGSGIGTSINEVIQVIEKIMKKKLWVCYKDGRKADVPINILNIDRYKKNIGRLIYVPLEEGVRKTARFLMNEDI